MGFNKYKNKKNRPMNINIRLKFFPKKWKKLIFFKSIIINKDIKYCIKITTPTNLMLIKKQVKKDNKIIFLISNSFLIK